MNGNEKASSSERAAGGGPQPDEAPRPAPAELQPERDQLADERARAEREGQIAVEFLGLVNASTGLEELIAAATAFFQQQSGCDAVGIRLRQGDDYPYYETRGFPAAFVLAENSLCAVSEEGKPRRDDFGNPVLECMCGNVICGRFDAAKPFFTPAGSFWTNSTTELLATMSEADRQGRTRNRCNGEGYESVALIALSSGGRRLGLLQLNHRRRGAFTAEGIAFWERLAGYLAVAVAKSQAETELRKSEDRYRSLFDKMTEGFALHEIVCDEQGEACDYRFLDVNPAFEALTGLPREAWIGKTVREVLPGEKPEWIEIYGRVALGGQPAHFDSYSTALGRHYNVFAYCPAPRQFAVLFTDVTAGKQAEEALRESQACLALAANAAQVGMFDWNILTGEAACTGQTERIFGNAPTAALTRTATHRYQEWLGCVHPDDRPWLEERLGHSMTERTSYRIEYRVIWPDGSVHWVASQAQTYFDGDGRATRILGTVMEVTERKRAEETLRYQAELLDRISDAVVSTDAVFRITSWNKAAERIYGWSAEEAMGKDVDVLLCAQFPGRGRRETIEQLWTAGFVEAEITHCDRQGQRLFVQGNVTLLKNSLGEATGTLAVLRDITRRKQAEEKAQANRAELEAALAAATDAVFISDAEGRFIDFNEAFATFHRFKNKGECGRSLAAYPELLDVFLADGELARLDQWAVPRALRGETVENAEYTLRRKDTGETWIGSYSFAPIRDKQGSVVGSVVVARDITDRKRAEQERLDLQRSMLHAQKLESLGVLAGGIAHDFNNLLAGIMGYADLALLGLPEGEPVRDDIKVIRKTVQRAADLTRQMLAYSGKGKFLLEAVDLSRIVEESKKILAMSVSKKATVTYNLATDLPAVQADAAQMCQVLMNLVINASEALGDHGGAITVSTSASGRVAADWAPMAIGKDLPEGLYVCLEVTDTGIGMSKETQQRIFEPFFTTKFTGRGLGLAALDGIVRGHKGAIELSSELGVGTTFRVYFPASGSRHAASVSAPAAAAERASGMVLVVDDEALVRMLARRMLESAGLSVLTADGWREAVRLLGEHRDEVGCVLLDLTMPDLDGAETLRELRRICADLPAVLSSGYNEEAATEQFAGVELSGFVQKPYESEVLLAEIRRALRKR